MGAKIEPRSCNVLLWELGAAFVWQWNDVNCPPDQGKDSCTGIGKMPGEERVWQRWGGSQHFRQGKGNPQGKCGSWFMPLSDSHELSLLNEMSCPVHVQGAAAPEELGKRSCSLPSQRQQTQLRRHLGPFENGLLPPTTSIFTFLNWGHRFSMPVESSHISICPPLKQPMLMNCHPKSTQSRFSLAHAVKVNYSHVQALECWPPLAVERGQSQGPAQLQEPAPKLSPEP